MRFLGASPSRWLWVALQRAPIGGCRGSKSREFHFVKIRKYAKNVLRFSESTRMTDVLSPQPLGPFASGARCACSASSLACRTAPWNGDTGHPRGAENRPERRKARRQPSKALKTFKTARGQLLAEVGMRLGSAPRSLGSAPSCESLGMSKFASADPRCENVGAFAVSLRRVQRSSANAVRRSLGAAGRISQSVRPTSAIGTTNVALPNTAIPVATAQSIESQCSTSATSLDCE
jgi:hypothetical protein